MRSITRSISTSWTPSQNSADGPGSGERSLCGEGARSWLQGDPRETRGGPARRRREESARAPGVAVERSAIPAKTSGIALPGDALPAELSQRAEEVSTQDLADLLDAVAPLEHEVDEPGEIQHGGEIAWWQDRAIPVAPERYVILTDRSNDVVDMIDDILCACPEPRASEEARLVHDANRSPRFGDCP